MTFGLLGLVLYIGSLLKAEKTTITTIKKTKASSITYTKIIDLGLPEASTPSPTEIILAQNITPSGNLSPTVVTDLSVTPEVTAEPTSTFLASNITTTPTEIPLASLVVTQGKTITPARTSSLPASGRTDYLMTMITLASLIIFLSFLY